MDFSKSVLFNTRNGQRLQGFTTVKKVRVRRSLCADLDKKVFKTKKISNKLINQNSARAPIGIKSILKPPKTPSRNKSSHRHSIITKTYCIQLPNPPNPSPNSPISTLQPPFPLSSTSTSEPSHQFTSTLKIPKPSSFLPPPVTKRPTSTSHSGSRSRLLPVNGSTHRTTLEHDSNVTRKTIAFFKTALLRICYRSFRDKECDYVKINKVVTKPKMRIYMKPLNKKFVPSAFSRTSNKKFFITRKFKGKPGEEWKHKKMHLGLSLLPSTKSTSEIEKASKEAPSSKDSSSEAKTSHRLVRFENKKLRDKKIIRMNKVIKKREFKKEESISSIKEFKICVLPPIRKQRK